VYDADGNPLENQPLSGLGDSDINLAKTKNKKRGKEDLAQAEKSKV
jgi:hypothetical protein